MSTADWVVLVAVALAGLYGLQTGFLRGAFSLAGFALGAYLGARLAPTVLADDSPYSTLLTLVAAILGGVVMRMLAGLLAGVLRTSVGVIPGVRALDRLAGLVLGLAAGVLLCWAVGAVLLYMPGQFELRRAVQRSAILTWLNDEFPPERLLETLERVDPMGVFVGPRAIVAPPDTKLTRDPDVIAAADSVVRVTGIACGLGVEGSGWIARPGTVVTNAHVVAGLDRPRVERIDGSSYSGTVVGFDATNDLAVLRVRGLPGRALPVAQPVRGTPIAIVGYPRNGPLTRVAGRLGGTRRVITRDAYERGPVTRVVTALRGLVEPGGSGGPGIDASGRVRTTIFGRRPGEQAGYGIPSDLVLAAVGSAGSQPVATECAR